MTTLPYDAGHQAGYNKGYIEGWEEGQKFLEQESTRQYRLGHQDGLGQRCQHHFACWDTWWGFLSFCFFVNIAVDALFHLIGWR